MRFGTESHSDRCEAADGCTDSNVLAELTAQLLCVCFPLVDQPGVSTDIGVSCYRQQAYPTKGILPVLSYGPEI